MERFALEILTLKKPWDFPGGPEVKNPPCNAGDTCSIPGQGNKIPCVAEQLSLCATTKTQGSQINFKKTFFKTETELAQITGCMRDSRARSWYPTSKSLKCCWWAANLTVLKTAHVSSKNRQAIMETAAQLATNVHARLRTKENEQTASVHTVCLLLKPWNLARKKKRNQY